MIILVGRGELLFLSFEYPSKAQRKRVCEEKGGKGNGYEAFALAKV